MNTDLRVVFIAVERIRELSAAHEEGEVDDETFAAQKAMIFDLTDSTV